MPARFSLTYFFFTMPKRLLISPERYDQQAPKNADHTNKSAFISLVYYSQFFSFKTVQTMSQSCSFQVAQHFVLKSFSRSPKHHTNLSDLHHKKNILEK